jgi:hypothetical protein
VKVYTYLNFTDVLLLHGYDVGNPLRVSAKSNESHVKWSFYLLLNPIVNNRIKPPNGLFVRPETRFDRKLIFY